MLVRFKRAGFDLLPYLKKCRQPTKSTPCPRVATPGVGVPQH